MHNLGLFNSEFVKVLYSGMSKHGTIVKSTYSSKLFIMHYFKDLHN